MASFSSGFQVFGQYLGAGINLPSIFYAHFPPEAGCLGISSATDALTIKASLTEIGRQYLARSITDGTSIKITEFAVGSAGYDVSYPLAALPVNPKDTALQAEVFRNEINAVETPLSSGIAKAFVCKLTREDLKAGIGEIALFAEIIDSPYVSEIGTKFPFVIVHQPLSGKTHHHVQTFRIVTIF